MQVNTPHPPQGGAKIQVLLYNPPWGQGVKLSV